MSAILSYYFFQEKNGLYPIARELIDRAVEHARTEHPNESCGVIVANGYYPMENKAPKPREDFIIDPNEYGKLLSQFGSVDAIMHSHPDGMLWPSKNDMQAQMNVGVPYGIIVNPDNIVQDIFFFGEQVPIAPYEGRPFKHGVYDCYELARDWFRKEHQIILKRYPREHLWWQTKEDMLVTYFGDAGFHEIGWNELEYGDAIAISLPPIEKTSHVGIHLGNGLLLHHLYGSQERPRLSRKEPIFPWKQYTTHCFRYKDGLRTFAIRNPTDATE